MIDSLNFTKETLLFQDNGLPQFSIRMPDYTLHMPNQQILISEYGNNVLHTKDINVFAYARYEGEQLISFRDIDMWQQHHLFGHLEVNYSGNDGYLGHVYLVEQILQQEYSLFHRAQIIKLLWFTLIEYNNYFQS